MSLSTKAELPGEGAASTADKAGREPVMVLDRHSGKMVEERVLGDRWLRLAYAKPWHLFFRFAAFRGRLLSQCLGWYCDSRLSRPKIARTVADLGIDLTEIDLPLDAFESFNAFFTRALRGDARPHSTAPEVACCPADSRLTVWQRLSQPARVPIKGLAFTVAEMLGHEHQALAGDFADGAAVVCRLCPADYHRFHYPAAGRVVKQWRVSGRYDSVHPIALSSGRAGLSGNVRSVALLDLAALGRALFIEVGAFGVARIVHTHNGSRFDKMTERGYFSFGGSTVVLVFEPGRIILDPDLLRNSAAGLETLIRVGDRLGVAGHIASAGETEDEG